mmetsp:Transcript_110014/g.206214  ORF Transcript_110014/g.206214 Transcript_110014/m.206214 type:complete len:322 (+) Transcript_110014:98-1063(+)
MSDDRVLGHVGCGIKRTTVILVVAILFSLYGTFHSMSLMVFMYSSQKSITPTHCSGSRCTEILTCHGLQEATWHVKEAALVIGGAILGPLGAYGILHRFPKDVFFFGVFLSCMAVLYTVLMLADFLYLAACNRYPYNVIDETILWEIPGIPVRQGIKYEVEKMESFPHGYLDALTYRPVERMYACIAIAEVALWAFLAYQVFLVAERLYYGLIGLGANFSIEEWRENALLKFQMQDVAYNTMDLAAATFEDVNWQYDGDMKHWKWYGRPVSGMPQYNMPQGPCVYLSSQPEGMYEAQEYEKQLLAHKAHRAEEAAHATHWV